MSSRSLSPLLVCVVAGFACSVNDSSAATLRDDAAAVCNPNRHLLVSSSEAGRFMFNHAVVDSAQLLTALRNILPPRPEKVVMVHLSNDRSAQVAWIVPAINAAGGEAYKPDSACLPSASGPPLFP